MLGPEGAGKKALGRQRAYDTAPLLPRVWGLRLGLPFPACPCNRGMPPGWTPEHLRRSARESCHLRHWESLQPARAPGGATLRVSLAEGPLAIVVPLTMEALAAWPVQALPLFAADSLFPSACAMKRPTILYLALCRPSANQPSLVDTRAAPSECAMPARSTRISCLLLRRNKLFGLAATARGASESREATLHASGCQRPLD
mmetsp:Transcript_82989/g.231571  ORF Transcript_82989/g.231571 Transcript_82989/m.231571 type:complete len:202 (+) Transcript_82989:251-856(+)